MSAIDNEGFEGRPTIRRALATLGTIEGYAVGGCCDLSTSTHHLVQRLGVEQGYNLAKESGRDLEEGIACATAGLRRRFAARVWRDYYKHVDARRRYANPTDEGLAAQQRDRQIEEESRRRENEERVALAVHINAYNRTRVVIDDGLGLGGADAKPSGKTERPRRCVPQDAHRRHADLSQH